MKIEVNNAAVHILPRGDMSLSLKFFSQQQVCGLPAKADLCPKVGDLPKYLIEEDLKARSAVISTISGSLSLDLVKST